ncbi:MAG: PASTA domain-containing protein [Clostridia bacterium]|nr:PASTA domain-containing protein [Clostridia bacterium]
MEKNLSFKDLVGTTLDSRYKIEKCLGTGGMSVVFKATDLRDGSAVAIKMLRDDVADDKESLSIFMNESKVVSMLSHPNIVSIRAVSFKTEKKYLVMEYIDGISLRTYMDRRGALDFDEFISFSEQILAALEHAHSRGVVHRDIKPQNILVLKDGFIKVTDFGIAKVPEKSKGKTISDNAIGTVYYISPEQAAGKSTDSRSDLYSFGVLMYEMATGRLPFDDERPISILMMQIHDKPLPPRKINRQIPRGLERLILTLMEKDPRRRYQTAKDVFIQIRRLGDNPLVSVPSPKQMATEARSRKNRTERPPSRSFFPIALGIACAVCFIGLVSVFYGLDALNFGAPGTSSLKVPDSVGVEYSEEIITELGFNEEDYIVTVEYLTSNTVEKGKIISQKPSAGARRKSPCHVTISVSIGPELVTFGDYLMMNWRVAQTRLRSEGYGVNIIREENAAIPEGYVYATEPMPGEKVAPGSMINVYVSAGTEQVLVTLPGFVGMTEREAKTFLDVNNLLVGDVTYTRSPMKAGTVIATSHEAGVGAYAYVTAIDFVVSGGEDFALKVCPDVIGKDAELSKKELELYGVDVNLITVRDEAPAGTVIVQSPSATDAVASNAHSMTLTVSGGPTYTRTVNMMNLVGQSLSGARAILDYMFEGVCEYKLNVTYTMSLKPKDTVLSQIPREGKIELSTGVLEITLVLSGGTSYTPATVSVVVPNVTGMSLAEAESRLLDAGILISNINYAQSYAAAGKVIFQSVDAGQIITGPQGWITIDLVVSSGYNSPILP